MNSHLTGLERKNILDDFDLENARLDLEIAELEQKKARNLYAKALYLATNSLHTEEWRNPQPKVHAV